jgi:hypothetical protein
VDRLARAGRRANRWPLAAHLRLYPRLIARPQSGSAIRFMITFTPTQNCWVLALNRPA